MNKLSQIIKTGNRRFPTLFSTFSIRSTKDFTFELVTGPDELKETLYVFLARI